MNTRRTTDRDAYQILFTKRSLFNTAKTTALSSENRDKLNLLYNHSHAYLCPLSSLSLNPPHLYRGRSHVSVLFQIIGRVIKGFAVLGHCGQNDLFVPPLIL